MTGEDTSKVGYKKPPKHTQFKKGTSGNPRGRPRKRENLNTLLQRVLNRKVTVKDAEERVPIRDALMWKLRDHALLGDTQALALQRRILTDAGYDDPEALSFEEEQKSIQKVLANLPDWLRAKGDADE